MQLEGRAILVTGASSGIGRATSFALAARGARIALAARGRAELEEVHRFIEQHGGRSAVFPTDVSDEGQVLTLVEGALETFGELDALAQCAGIARWGSLASQPSSEWRAMIEVNLLGPLYAVQAILPHFLERRAGHLVQVASVAAIRPRSGNAVYAATKAALMTASESLRQELSETGVRVTWILPGLVDTPMVEDLGDAVAEQWVEQARKSFPFLQPEDVARAVIYALEQPEDVAVNEIVVRPRQQPT